MMQYALYALPLSVVWMIVSDQLNPLGWGIGYGLSLVLLLVVFPHMPRKSPNLAALPAQVFWIVYYVLYLILDIIRSSIDVARRVLAPSMPINPGVLKVNTQDKTRNPLISALSAHAITITPGELVVDFDGTNVMEVHCLDVQDSRQRIDEEQTRRLALIRKVIEQ